MFSYQPLKQKTQAIPIKLILSLKESKNVFCGEYRDLAHRVTFVGKTECAPQGW